MWVSLRRADICLLHLAGSLQLCKLGVELIVYRLTSSAMDKPTAAQLHTSFATGVRLVQSVVEFLENLAGPDYAQFWSPCQFTPFAGPS